MSSAYDQIVGNDIRGKRHDVIDLGKEEEKVWEVWGDVFRVRPNCTLTRTPSFPVAQGCSRYCQYEQYCCSKDIDAGLH